MLALCGMLAAGRAEALSLSLATATPSIGLGQVALVDVWVSGFDEGQTLRAFDLDLLFDEPPLGYASLEFDVLLGAPGAEAVTSGGALGAGQVDLAESSVLSGAALDGLQGSSFRLAQIGLRGLEPGLAELGFGPAELIGLGAVTLPVTATSGLTIEVLVPEASALATLGLGLAMLALVRAGRRREG